ncbi:MAG: CopG family ribbon-helix-helix protein [Candidatus Thermoplasmatota archaeon]
MTKIISMSLSDELLTEIDRIQKEGGFSGRSEVMRAGIRMLLADTREKERLVGRHDAVLIAIHSPSAEDAVTLIKHSFEDIITTQMHSHLKDDKCMEIFTIQGEAPRIREFVRSFQHSKKLEYLKLIVA